MSEKFLRIKSSTDEMGYVCFQSEKDIMDCLAPISALLFLFLSAKGRIRDLILDVQVKHVQRDMKYCFAFFAF